MLYMAGPTAMISPAMLTCMSMRTLWQVDCFCPEVDACESRRYACFWDLSVDGLAKNPEMADLYAMFRADMLECREISVKSDDIGPCEDKALMAALARCERRLSTPK